MTSYITIQQETLNVLNVIIFFARTITSYIGNSFLVYIDNVSTETYTTGEILGC